MIVHELSVKGEDGVIRQVSPIDVEAIWPTERPVVLLASGERVVFIDGDNFVLLDQVPLMLLLEEGMPEECWVSPSAVRRIMGGLPTEVILKSGCRFQVREGAVELRKRRLEVLRMDRRLLAIAA